MTSVKKIIGAAHFEWRSIFYAGDRVHLGVTGSREMNSFQLNPIPNCFFSWQQWERWNYYTPVQTEHSASLICRFKSNYIGLLFSISPSVDHDYSSSYNTLLKMARCCAQVRTGMFSRAMTLYGLIDLSDVCRLGMLSGFVYNAPCSTSQIGDWVLVVRDYRLGLWVFHYFAVSENNNNKITTTFW